MLLLLCCSSQCILGSVDSNSVEKCCNAPHVVTKWAVKLRGWALWLAGSSLPYINNNSYNKIKIVTKCSHKSKQTLEMTEGYTSHVPVMFFFFVFFKRSVTLSVKSISHLKSTHLTHTVQPTIHTHSSACIRTHTCILTDTVNSQHNLNTNMRFPP